MATESFLCIWNDPWFNMYPLLDFKCRTGRKYWARYEFLAAQPLFTAHIQKSLNIFLYKREMILHMENIFSYKTQCQLCKRLAGPIIPLYRSGLLWSGKRVLALITWTQSRSTFFISEEAILAWWRRTNKQPGETRASLLVEQWAKQTFCKVVVLCVELSGIP